MGASASVRVAFETARLHLAEIRNEGKEARVAAYRIACKHSADTLQVARVSIWFLAEDDDALLCMLQYQLAQDRFDSGEKLLRRDCPRYFEAIRSRRVVVAGDALHDEQTSELQAYLKQGNISALLDAPIYRDGRVIGVVCHEHVGASRAWTEKEAGFACAVADMLTILIQQAERAELRAAIDAQQKLEAQHQKMQALVKLGRVVTHDLSNILTVASLRAGLLNSEPDIDSASEEMVEVLRYGSELLRQLRDFCDEREPTSVVEVRSTLASLAPALSAILGKQITFRQVCDIEPTELAVAKVEFEQLILNLCMNARDAIALNGEVSVTIGKTQEQISIEVRDNGSGMDEQTQLRLFEPFYSTKAGHSGIGLSAVYGIVERARGRIEVNSAPGKGTTFRVYLPLTTSGASLEAPWNF
jgi:two-component system cell cycle sensor histidine kinase/response regulator CckA